MQPSRRAKPHNHAHFGPEAGANTIKTLSAQEIYVFDVSRNQTPSHSLIRRGTIRRLRSRPARPSVMIQARQRGPDLGFEIYFEFVVMLPTSFAPFFWVNNRSTCLTTSFTV